MNSIWILIYSQSVTYGHGDYGECLAVVTQGPYDTGDPHPAFKSKKEALEYKNSIDKYSFYELLEFKLK